MGKSKIPHLHRRSVYMTADTVADFEVLSIRWGGASRSQVIRELAAKEVAREITKGARARERARVKYLLTCFIFIYNS